MSRSGLLLGAATRASLRKEDVKTSLVALTLLGVTVLLPSVLIAIDNVVTPTSAILRYFPDTSVRYLRATPAPFVTFLALLLFFLPLVAFLGASRLQPTRKSSWATALQVCGTKLAWLLSVNMAVHLLAGAAMSLVPDANHDVLDWLILSFLVTSVAAVPFLSIGLICHRVSPSRTRYWIVLGCLVTSLWLTGVLAAAAGWSIPFLPSAIEASLLTGRLADAGVAGCAALAWFLLAVAGIRRSEGSLS